MLLPWSAPLPDDTALIETGFMRGQPQRPAADRVMLLCAGALVRDAAEAVALLGAHHVDIEALPARLHLRPDLTVPALRARARVAVARGYGRVAALFGDDGSGGAVAAMATEEGIVMPVLPSCASAYAGPGAAPPGPDGEALLLNDFLLRHFDRLFWHPMHLDSHPELVDVLFGPDQRLVHLAQRNDPHLDAFAIRVAVRLNRPVERRDAPVSALAATLAPLLPAPAAGVARA